MKIPSSLQLSFFTNKCLPVVLQTEAAECGLACIAMVASYWGYRIDLSSMRQRFSVSLKGATLKDLMTLGLRLNLQPRPLKLEMNHLPNLNLPAVLHWDMNHFVVLKSVTRTHGLIHDPGAGERCLALDELAKHFTGVALELTPTSEFSARNESRSFSLISLMGRVIGLRRGLAKILLLGLALQVCALIAPFYMQWVVDEALLTADRELMNGFSAFVCDHAFEIQCVANRHVFNADASTAQNVACIASDFDGRACVVPFRHRDLCRHHHALIFKSPELQ